MSEPVLVNPEERLSYVARWARGSRDLVKETGERVIVCAQSMLARLIPRVPECTTNSTEANVSAAP